MKATLKRPSIALLMAVLSGVVLGCSGAQPHAEAEPGGKLPVTIFCMASFKKGATTPHPAAKNPSAPNTIAIMQTACNIPGARFIVVLHSAGFSCRCSDRTLLNSCLQPRRVVLSQ